MHAETPMSAEPARLAPIPSPASDRAATVARPIGADVLAELLAMRRFLEAERPASGNEALKLLRAAFPDAPLDVRVKAVADRGPAF